jgi:hypothetical protein
VCSELWRCLPEYPRGVGGGTPPPPAHEDATDPQTHEQLEYTQGELRQYDPTHEGIYDKDMVRAMEQFSQTRRLTNNVGVVLAEQGSKFTNPSHISPHDLLQEIPVVSFDFLGWLGDLLDHWGTILAGLTLLLVCFKALSFASGLLARCLAAHRIWGCQFHLLAAVLPSVLQWMAIQLGLRGAWPVIEGGDPTDRETESFLTHARQSVMKDRLSKKEWLRKNDYHHEGGLAELGTLGTKRKEPTGCNSIIDMHETEPFSFTTVPMGSTLSPAAFHRQQLAQHHKTSEHTTIDLPVCHPMYVAGNQRLQEHRAGHTRHEEEGFPGELTLAEGGMDRSLSPGARSEDSGNGVNLTSGHP